MPQGEKGLQVVADAGFIRFAPEHLHVAAVGALEHDHVHEVHDCEHL